MRWTSRKLGAAPVAGLIAVGFAMLWMARAAAFQGRDVAVYSSSASVRLRTVERDGREYIGLRDAFEPLAETTLERKGDRWELAVDGRRAEFRPGERRFALGSERFELPAPFLVETDRPLVPLAGLPQLYSALLRRSIEWRAEARRLFIGDVAVRFTAELRREEAGTVLVLSFTAPVNPVVATEPGALRLNFAHDPVVSSTPVLHFDSRLITSLWYKEGGGGAEISIAGGAPLMAIFGNGGRTITIVSPPAPPVVLPPPSLPAAETPPPRLAPEVIDSTTPPPPLPRAPARPRYLVAIDASHGGQEPGAVLDGALVEKEVTLALARRLRQALHQRGLATLMVRDSDATLRLDDRAAIVNSSQAAVFVSLHAVGQGQGVRVHTALLPSRAGNGGDRAFVPWEQAQAAHLNASRALADSVTERLQREQLLGARMPAPVRPLNNVAAAAIAIEVAPPAADPRLLTSPRYQEAVASALADGVAAARARVEAAQ